jgi:hypothetical protein
MNLTNIHDLPQALVDAVRNDPYTGGGDISVTKLIDSAQRRVLLKKFGASVVEDVSERIWSLLGQAVHTILERANKSDIVEERLYADVEGWSLSGQFDRMDLRNETLDDYKCTSVYKVMMSDMKEWERQLNVLRWLAIQNGYKVERLRIIAILRDWRKSDAKRKQDYPQKPVATIDIPVWPLDETYQYIRDRISLHQAAEAGGTLIVCTDEERWYAGTTYALMKPGGKRAIKIFERKEDAESALTDSTVIEERRGGYRRCEEYCEVSEFCEQYQSSRENSEPTFWESGEGS